MKIANWIGWGAVVLVTSISGFWAFWGVLEAFHEGWCKPYWYQRVLQLLAYLAPATVLCLLTVLSLRWPRLGASLFILVGLVIAALMIWDRAYFGLFLTLTLTAIPALVGLLFLIGRPTPKRAAYACSVGVPLLIVLGFGVEPAFRVSTRLDDGFRGARIIEGNGVVLQWAPAGPGWSREGLISWDEAVRRARYLTDDGSQLADTPQDIWRLPTRGEIVRSLTRGGRNAGGTWNAQHASPNYERRPDKESPLWDPYAPLIYLWTAEEQDSDRAWIVVYHGGVFVKPKAIGSPSFGFRAVRVPPHNFQGEMAMSLRLTSTAFAEGQAIPVEHTGDGANTSPPLAWTEPPKGTASFALICEDPDAPRGIWTHWVVFNLPATTHELAKGVPHNPKLASGGLQGKNDFGKIGYGGPAPPPGKPHRYFFRFYALDSLMKLESGATRKELLDAMKGHVLAEAHLMGTYQR